MPWDIPRKGRGTADTIRHDLDNESRGGVRPEHPDLWVKKSRHRGRSRAPVVPSHPRRQPEGVPAVLGSKRPEGPLEGDTAPHVRVGERLLPSSPLTMHTQMVALGYADQAGAAGRRIIEKDVAVGPQRLFASPSASGIASSRGLFWRLLMKTSP